MSSHRNRTRSGRRFSVCLLAPLVCLSSSSWAQQQPALTAKQMTTREATRATERALAYLARRQGADGVMGRSDYGRNVGVIGLVGLAWMSGGSTPGRGPYGKNINQCVDYVLQHTQESGFVNAPEGSSHGPMYGHGFATMFLAEAYGMSPREDLRDKLARAVKLIINTQNDEGGWRYRPVKGEADISVTICQIMALRAARNAGLYVPLDTVERCIEYVKRSQNPDGGFMYTLEGGASEFPRSAAGVVALYSSGIYEGPELAKGLAYLDAYLADNRPRDRLSNHFFYGQYYAAQANWQAGGEAWSRWFPQIRDQLVSRQSEDGSWIDTICPEYGTAMAAIILQIPNNCLPIFQR